MSAQAKPGSCPDCGPTPIPHALAWWSSVIDWFIQPYTRLLDRTWRRLKPHLARRVKWDRFAFRSMFWLQRLGIGKVVTELKDDHSLRTRALWEEAKRRGIELFEFRPFGRSVELMVARRRGKLFAFDGLPRPRGYDTSGLQWMDDKGIMRDRLRAAGVPVARGGVATLAKRALELFDKVGPPLIVKPRLGSRSRHTFMHIESRDQLVQAFYSAQKLCPWVVVEEELQGPVFRATVIGGTLVGVARRDMPHVVGDGVKTIGQLVREANEHPRRHGNSIYTTLPGEAEAAAELARQELAWQSVPPAGQQVLLAQKVNRGLGGVTTEVTEETHSDNRALFEKTAQVVGDPIIGIDFIVRTVVEPWHEQGACGVIECNSLPFIDLHHYPIAGKPQNAAGAVWDLVQHYFGEEPGQGVAPAAAQGS